MRTLLLLCLFFPFIVFSQTQSKVFQVELYKHVLTLNDDKSYFTFAHSYEPQNQISPQLTREESGEIIVEGNLSPVMGVLKPDSSRHPFFQRMRLSVPATINLRLLRGASSPMAPPSNQVGIKLDYSLWSKCYVPNKSPIFFLTVEARHYSNGQGPGSRVPDDNNGQRNDYASGDFSTNFLKYAATYTTFIGSRGRHVFSIRGFYQKDFDFSDVLSFLDVQNGRYGKHRVGGTFTYEIFSNILADQIKIFLLKSKQDRYALTPIVEGEIINILDDIEGGENWSYRLRVILGFDALNEFGLFYQYYQGRDYLNIRYDLPVRYHAFGLHFRPF